MSQGEVDKWRERAACRGMDPNVFFPDKGADHLAAMEICFDCPVRLECLDSALSRREPGIWGGTSERQRKRMRRRVPRVRPKVGVASDS